LVLGAAGAGAISADIATAVNVVGAGVAIQSTIPLLNAGAPAHSETAVLGPAAGSARRGTPKKAANAGAAVAVALAATALSVPLAVLAVALAARRVGPSLTDA
jgi:hypothetical protein